MFQSIDAMEKVLNNEQVTDPSVTPDTNVLDLQAVVARLDRIEQTIADIVNGGKADGANTDNSNGENGDNSDSAKDESEE